MKVLLLIVTFMFTLHRKYCTLIDWKIC